MWFRSIGRSAYFKKMFYLIFGGVCASEMKRGRANGHAFMTACPSHEAVYAELYVVRLLICDVMRL